MSVYKRAVFGACNKTLYRCFTTSPILSTFHVSDEKGGYKDKRQIPPAKQRIREGLKELKQEVALWSKEWKEHLESDPLLVFRPGETDIQWQFKDLSSLDNWVYSSDSDHDEGYSTCSLSLTNQAKGLFSGDLSTRIPKDGRISRTGYCNIKTLPFRRSFKRSSYMNWALYNILVLRIRGDGRSYFINIGTRGYYDITWNDMYHYVLFTRGGPYWQTARIPLSKFFWSSRGRIQDKQVQVPLERISSFGITIADKVNGPFALEIDYVGVEFDPNHKEEFAYELYRTEDYIAAT